MKHMDMKCLIVASLIAAPAIAGNSSSKSNKVTTSIREIETVMFASSSETREDISEK